MLVDNTHPLSLPSLPMKHGTKRKIDDEVNDAVQFTFTETERISPPSPKKFKAESIFSDKEDAMIKYLDGQITDFVKWKKISKILKKLKLGSIKTYTEIHKRYKRLKSRGLHLITDDDKVIIKKYKPKADKFTETITIERKSSSTKKVWTEEETALLKLVSPIFNNVSKSISIFFRKLNYVKTPLQCSNKYHALKNKNLTDKEQKIISKMKNIIDKALKEIPIQSKKRTWDENEVSLLIQGVIKFGKDWKKVEAFLKENGVNRSASQAESKFKSFNEEDRTKYLSEFNKKNAKPTETNSKVEQDLRNEQDESEDQVMHAIQDPVPEEDFSPPEIRFLGALEEGFEELDQFTQSSDLDDASIELVLNFNSDSKVNEVRRAYSS